MTSWLEPLPLRCSLELGGGTDLEDQPDWAYFMIFLGWWLAELPLVRGTIHCVALVPTRVCCPSLVATGVLLSSASRPDQDLDWGAFASLPLGTRVFFRNPRPKGRHEVHSGLIAPAEHPGLVCVRMNESETFTRLELGRSSFLKYSCRLTPFPSAQRMGRLDRVGKFLDGLLRRFDRRWLLSAMSCCMVVTSAASWRREVCGITLRQSRTGAIPLQDLLMAQSADPSGQCRIVLEQPGGASAAPERLPLVVLDGPRAFRSLRSHPSFKAVTLLEHSEYDEEVAGDLASLTSLRNEEMWSPIRVSEQPPPAGIDVLFFAVPEPGP